MCEGQSDEEPPVVRREVTSEMVAARNRAADEVLAQIRGEKSQADKLKALLQCPVVVRSLMLVESLFLTVKRSGGPCSNRR